MYTLKLYVRGDMDMKDVLLDEVKKELNWKERIIIKIFKKTIIKIYGIAGKNVFNSIFYE